MSTAGAINYGLRDHEYWQSNVWSMPTNVGRIWHGVKTLFKSFLLGGTHFFHWRVPSVSWDGHGRGRQACKTEDPNVSLLTRFHVALILGDFATNWPSSWLIRTVKNTHSSSTAFGIRQIRSDRHCSAEWEMQLLKIFADFLVDIKSKSTFIISHKKLLFFFLCEYACNFAFVINLSVKILARLVLKRMLIAGAILCQKCSGWQSLVLTGANVTL